MKNISVLGAGGAGTALISNLKSKGYDVTVGLRNPEKYEGAVTIKAAIEANKVVIFAVPFGSGVELAKEYKDEFSGKIVIDMMNPLLENLSGYQTFDGKSGGEFLQEIIPDAKVVKAFNHAIAPSLAEPNGSVQFIIGNDKEAVDEITTIASTLGFEANPIYDLSKVREIEAMAYFWIYFTIIVKDNPFLKLKVTN